MRPNPPPRFDMVEDLTTFLFNNNLLKYIEGYVQKVSPGKAPQVRAGGHWSIEEGVELG